MEANVFPAQYIQKKYKDVLNNSYKNKPSINNVKWLLGTIYRKKRTIICLAILIYFIMRYVNTDIERIPVVRLSNVSIPSGYLVWSDNCKMIDIDPYASEVITYLKRKEFVSCPSDIPLTGVIFNTTVNKYILFINEDKKQNLDLKERKYLSCCYRVIKRVTDSEVEYSYCHGFENPVTLREDIEHLIVRCGSGKNVLHISGHALMPEREELRKFVNDWKKNDSKKRLNVILLGIDAISRVNLIRAMPKTAQYLYDNNWFEMSGYNKMGLNTFPNLMAVLTGLNQSSVGEQCDPTKIGGLDGCPFIWKTFKEHGYVTAYAEDTAQLSTFNYFKKGFNSSPVDHYFRPFILGAENKLPTTKGIWFPYCVGSKPGAFYVFDYALELDARHSNDAYFGLFWTNTCHQDVNDASSMDDSFVGYLRKFAHRGVLERSIVIFFSDHGIRWGPTRRTMSGFFEDRRPFLFIWLPPWLRYTYPDFVEVLRLNNNRLTSPYDLHMTLKHILEISGRSSNLPHAQDCPKCQSLLKPVPDNRSCDDAAIPELWCTCSPMTLVDKYSGIVKKIIDFSIEKLNEIIENYENGTYKKLCKKHSLSSITNAQSYNVPSGNKSFVNYLVVYKTKPNDAEFEAVVRYFVNADSLEMMGISRVGSESPDGDCVTDFYLKQFCSCHIKRRYFLP